MRIAILTILVASAALFGGCASEEGGDITGTTWQLISIQTQSAPVLGNRPGRTLRELHDHVQR